MTITWRVKFAVYFCILYLVAAKLLTTVVRLPNGLLNTAALVVCALMCVVLAGLVASKTTLVERKDEQFRAVLTSLFSVPGVKASDEVLLAIKVIPHGKNTLPPQAWLQGLSMSHHFAQETKKLIIACSDSTLSRFEPAKIEENQDAIIELLQRINT